MDNAPRHASADLVAGISIAGLLLPEAVAYSGLANLPPQAGVLALFCGLVAYALIGRSRHAIVTATSSSAAVLAAATATLAGEDPARRAELASLLVVGAGVAFLLAGGLRLGAMSNLIARPVLRGYAFGLALVIIVKQWPHIAGVRIEPAPVPALLLELLRGIGAWQPASLATGLGALAALMVLERLRRVPAPFLVILVGIAAAPWLAAHGVALVGPVRLALAWPRFVLPSGAEWLPTSEFALALMFILYAESYGSIRSCALGHGERVQPNRDLVALGIANVAAGLLHGTPVGAGYSATSANAAAGAQSRLAGVVAAVVVFVLVALFLPWIERIPQPLLAAIVIHAVSKSLRLSAFAVYVRWRRDRMLALAAVAAVLVFGVLDGLLAAIALSLAMLLRSLATPRLSVLGRVGEHDYVSTSRYAGAVTVPEMLVLRPEEPLFFANAEPLLAEAQREVLARAEVRLVILSLEESPDLDSTVLEALAEFCAWLAARGIEIRVARLKDAAREALLRAGLPQLPPAALDYSSVDDAVRGQRIGAD